MTNFFLRATPALLASLIFLVAIPVVAQRIEWPNGAKAAICLTYDDGMSSQLAEAIPTLNASKLRGTFFLNSIPDNRMADQWRKAAQQGHELGNHTLFHPCLASHGWKPVWALDNYTFDRILKEVQSMSSQLYLLDGKTATRSFAFPCSDTTAGGISYVDTLRRSGLARFGRMGGSADAIVANFATLDSLLVPSWAVQPSNTAADLIGFADKAAQQGGLGVYMFHGVGSQWIAVSAEDHKKLAAYLASHKETFWVTTFTEALAYVSQWNKKHPVVSRK